MYQESESPTLVKTEVKPTPKPRTKSRTARESKSTSPFGASLRTNLVSRYRFWKNLHKISGEMVERFEMLGKELNRK